MQVENFVRFLVGRGDIERGEGTVRLVVAGAEKERYADAQLDDYHGLGRSRLPWQPPVSLHVRARASHPAGELLGTAGFGFWNDPFTASGGIVAPPNALWFFFASAPSNMALVPGVPGRGWKATSLNSGRAPGPLLAPAVVLADLALRLPGVPRLLMPLARSMVRASERVLDGVDLMEWHTYELDWRATIATFQVDGQEVLRAPHPPSGPLGFVTWLDNQYAIASPSGDFAFGLIDIPQRQWLEIAELQVQRKA